MSRIAVYTAVFNQYDEVKPPEVVCNECDYFAFTEVPFVCPPWKVILAEQKEVDPRRAARRYKILSHILFDHYLLSMWMDGGTKLYGDTGRWIDEKIGDSEIAVKLHPTRNCAYDEAEACIAGKFDDPHVIAEQMARYKKEGYPEKNGLAWTDVLIRRHTKRVGKFNEMWWNEVKRGSKRDQLSFDRCLWKMPDIEVAFMPPNEDEMAKARKHLKNERVI